MKKNLYMSLIALLFLTVGCSKDENPSDTTNTAKGTLKINIEGEKILNGRAIGDPAQALENTVKSFTVYVFNYATGVLEKSQSFSSGFTGQISGLSIASPKRVVVFVNQPSGYPAISSYADFDNTSTMVSLDSQVPGDFSATGLFMSGESSDAIYLSETSTVGVTIPVKRLTAKVRLGSLTVTPDVGLSLDKFNLDKVSVQKTRDKALVFGNLATSGFNYVSGIQGNSGTSSTEAPKVYLSETYNLPVNYAGEALSPQVYFYVFPNDNTDNRGTMLTLMGDYDGETMYYSFYVNDKVSGSGENATDGTWIQRNKVYTLNVTLKKLGNGGEDPDVPNELVSMDVTIDVADWDSELIQNVEW